MAFFTQYPLYQLIKVKVAMMSPSPCSSPKNDPYAFPFLVMFNNKQLLPL